MALPPTTVRGNGRIQSEVIFTWSGKGDGEMRTFKGQLHSLSFQLYEDMGREGYNYECEFFKITAVAADGWKFDHWEYRNERWREYTYDSGPGSAEQTETNTSTSTLTFRDNPAVNADPEHSYALPFYPGLPIGSVRQETIWEWGEDEPPVLGYTTRSKREILRYRCVGLIAHFVRAKQVPRLVHDPVTRKLINAGLANKRLLNGM
jgi:hypothetical protein